ncbi:MAG: branched-chain amino acid ABC transporter substrate-binding protein [Acidobacteria bacterium]|nr:branched-chain amino acid ABC transporter substrate-binding protein [Acidobacteriota bacterium]
MRSLRSFIGHRRTPAGPRARLSAWAALLLLAASVGCAPPSSEHGVKVMLSTLVDSGSGNDVLRGVRLALDENGGQAGGYPVELVVVNTLDRDAEEPLSLDLERGAAERAVADPSFVAYFGPMASHQAKVSLPILNRASMPQISSSATWPGLTRAGFGPGEPGIYYPTGSRHFFRLVATDDEQAAAAARWGADLGFRSAFLIDNAVAYGRGLSGIFEETARDLGIEIVGRHSVALNDTGPEMLDQVVKEVGAAKPELIFYAGGIERRLLDLFRRLHSALPQVAFIATEGLQRNEFIEHLGPEAAEGFRATNIYLPVEEADTDAARRFERRYWETYGEAPQPLAAGSYEAMRVLLWAIEHARTPTREAVLEALQGMGEIEGLTGPLSFDARGDATVQTVSGYRVVGGRWVFEKVLD